MRFRAMTQAEKDAHNRQADEAIKARKDREKAKSAVFTYFWNERNSEYEVFMNGEIFCHLSENDFGVFSSIVRNNGNKLMRIS